MVAPDLCVMGANAPWVRGYSKDGDYWVVMINSFLDCSYGWDGATNVNVLALKGVALSGSFQPHRRFSVITPKVLTCFPNNFLKPRL
jgi:hypothetical protein